MSDYNYLNARIKSLKKDLFSKGKLEELLRLNRFEEVKRFFLESPYGTSVGEALTQHSDFLGIELGISNRIQKTFQKILEWSGEGPRRLMELLLRRYDLHNIKSLLRGKNGKLPVEAILETVIPVGSFSFEELKELAKQPSLRETVALLASWHHPLKRVLRRGLSSIKEESADLRTLEAELDYYYYSSILSSLVEEKGEDAELVKRLIQMEVDITNILTLLRLTDVPKGELSKFFIEGGMLGKGFLLSIATVKPLEMTQKFEITYLAKVARSWKGESLTPLERNFDAFLTQAQHRMERQDPLSIGVAISYLALLSNELKNIRMILQGKSFSLSEEKLKEELLLV
ncbi:MAG: V-type ATPase subunit [Candidatus Omnitrophica bacterium]|nr:V-type ATPase subunit [Candidatus Omnitrophota bacterium]